MSGPRSWWRRRPAWLVRRPGWLVVDWRLFAAVAVCLASASVLVAVYQLGQRGQYDQRLSDQAQQIDQLSRELECRSRAASATTLAIADLTAATGRGLAVLVADLQEDPELEALVEARLGSAGPEELRRQGGLVLVASDAAAEAKGERARAETECREQAREAAAQAAGD